MNSEATKRAAWQHRSPDADAEIIDWQAECRDYPFAGITEEPEPVHRADLLALWCIVIVGVVWGLATLVLRGF